MGRTAAVMIPPRQVSAVLESLVTMYEVKAEALSSAANDYLRDPAALATLRERQRELADIEEMIGELGWVPRERVGVAELAGPAGVVREVLLGALIHAAEGLPEACRRYEAGRVELGEIRAAVANLGAMLDLFAAAEAPSRE